MAGSRIFIQEGIYDTFLERFGQLAKGLGDAAGDPFARETQHGPQVSQTQFDVFLPIFHQYIPANSVH